MQHICSPFFKTKQLEKLWKFNVEMHLPRYVYMKKKYVIKNDKSKVIHSLL